MTRLQTIKGYARDTSNEHSPINNVRSLSASTSDLNLNHYGYGLIAQFPCLTASNFNSQGGQAEGERDLSSREPYRQLLQSTVVVLRAGADQRLPGRRYHAIKHRRDRKCSCGTLFSTVSRTALRKQRALSFHPFSPRSTKLDSGTAFCKTLCRSCCRRRRCTLRKR